MCGLVAPREATTGADTNTSPTDDQSSTVVMDGVGHGHHTGARTGEDVEMLTIILAAIITGTTTYFGYLCVLESQSPLQVVALRLKSLRMRIKVKCDLRN